jgi:hypothetical protein
MLFLKEKKTSKAISLKIEQSISSLWDKIKQYNICAVGASEE